MKKTIIKTLKMSIKLLLQMLTITFIGAVYISLATGPTIFCQR